MNASQRRTLRRAITKATGFVTGSLVKLKNGKTNSQYVVERVIPGGKREVLVKRGDNRRVTFPVGELVAV